MPAVAVYVIAIVGTVAVGIAFKEFIYDPHIAPTVDQWLVDIAARRQRRRRVPVPSRSHGGRAFEMEILTPAPITSTSSSSTEREHGVLQWRTGVESATLRRRTTNANSTGSGHASSSSVKASTPLQNPFVPMPVSQPSSSSTQLLPVMHMDTHILTDTETETDAGSDAGATDSRSQVTRTGESDFDFAHSTASIPSNMSFASPSAASSSTFHFQPASAPVLVDDRLSLSSLGSLALNNLGTPIAPNTYNANDPFADPPSQSPSGLDSSLSLSASYGSPSLIPSLSLSHPIPRADIEDGVELLSPPTSRAIFGRSETYSSFSFPDSEAATSERDFELVRSSAGASPRAPPAQLQTPMRSDSRPAASWIGSGFNSGATTVTAPTPVQVPVRPGPGGGKYLTREQIQYLIDQVPPAPVARASTSPAFSETSSKSMTSNPPSYSSYATNHSTQSGNDSSTGQGSRVGMGIGGRSSSSRTPLRSGSTRLDSNMHSAYSNSPLNPNLSPSSRPASVSRAAASPGVRTSSTSPQMRQTRSTHIPSPPSPLAASPRFTDDMSVSMTSDYVSFPPSPAPASASSHSPRRYFSPFAYTPSSGSTASSPRAAPATTTSSQANNPFVVHSPSHSHSHSHSHLHLHSHSHSHSDTDSDNYGSDDDGVLSFASASVSSLALSVSENEGDFEHARMQPGGFEASRLGGQNTRGRGRGVQGAQGAQNARVGERRQRSLRGSDVDVRGSRARSESGSEYSLV
ncbi:hypothetical protein BDP27DRAFT_1327668 [Rhodocollybia butyracea]|uniref:Uncharacterized protein n=1 Tax=Rhodocollybia butyracea TaxID=206335 RepID=A0A9P5U6T8_9AGAR|nr:hypothetical protein BDP27DRAFT_1327668 [Rhodocollybia butyracea]